MKNLDGGDSVLNLPMCLTAFCQTTQCFKVSINVR